MAAFAHWRLGFALQSITTPRSRSASAALIKAQSIKYLTLGLFFPKCSILHLSMLKYICHFFAQLERLLMITCISLFSAWDLILLTILVSSANFKMSARSDSMHSSMSSMKMIKIRGPRTVPWPTLQGTGMEFDALPLRTTLCERFDSQACTHAKTLTSMFMARILLNSR